MAELITQTITNDPETSQTFHRVRTAFGCLFPDLGLFPNPDEHDYEFTYTFHSSTPMYFTGTDDDVNDSDEDDDSGYESSWVVEETGVEGMDAEEEEVSYIHFEKFDQEVSSSIETDNPSHTHPPSSQTAGLIIALWMTRYQGSGVVQPRVDINGQISASRMPSPEMGGTVVALWLTAVIRMNLLNDSLTLNTARVNENLDWGDEGGRWLVLCDDEEVIGLSSTDDSSPATDETTSHQESGWYLSSTVKSSTSLNVSDGLDGELAGRLTCSTGPDGSVLGEYDASIDAGCVHMGCDEKVEAAVTVSGSTACRLVPECPAVLEKAVKDVFGSMACTAMMTEDSGVAAKTVKDVSGCFDFTSTASTLNHSMEPTEAVTKVLSAPSTCIATTPTPENSTAPTINVSQSPSSTCTTLTPPPKNSTHPTFSPTITPPSNPRQAPTGTTTIDETAQPGLTSPTTPHPDLPLPLDGNGSARGFSSLLRVVGNVWRWALGELVPAFVGEGVLVELDDGEGWA
ncbi:hypothetical protein HDU67_008789 [Dinochytrium kinnereticum]|nr:hypothetical protein HDU67_008789 [Dinochytrium kinnereticum]